MLLEVARGELIEPLLELRGSGWFYFWLWCLTGRNKNTVTESVRENVVKPIREVTCVCPCLLYTSDAADEDCLV